MIEGLDNLLDGNGQPGLPELRDRLRELLDAPGRSGRLRAHRVFKSQVHRLDFEIDGALRRVVVKRLDPDVAHRNRMVVERWLPAAGLESGGPILLGTAAEASGACVWHVYEDLGDVSLAAKDVDRASVEAAVRLVGRIHLRFADHPLLGETRLWGGDLGMHFYGSSVRDAIRALRPLDAGALPVRDRLLAMLEALLEQEASRGAMLDEHGGPETLLHGDLWRKNIFVTRDAAGAIRPRLIDWDHAAVGPFAYDLSTLLIRFAPGERSGVLDLYRDEVAAGGWVLPDDSVLNALFDTAERARIANRVIWPAIAIRHGGDAAWGAEALVEIEEWFDRLEPILSVTGGPGA